MTIHQPSIHGNLRIWSVGLVVMVLLMIAAFATVQAKSYGDIEQQLSLIHISEPTRPY